MDSTICLKGVGKKIIGYCPFDVNLSIFLHEFGRPTSDDHAFAPLIEYLSHARQQLRLVEALVETDSYIARCELTGVTRQPPRNAFRFVVEGCVNIPCTSCFIL